MGTVIYDHELGVPADLARRVLAHARMISPCIHSLEGDDRQEAVAVLQGVAQEAQARGVRSVTSQGVGSARVSYGSASSWFTDDDRDTLRVLCSAAASVAASGHPVGAFPRPPRAFRRVWPEDEGV